MGITTRQYGPNAKGSRLTTAEMDENFNHLENKMPYKVYTALLTQTGGDDPQSISSGAVTKGVTYAVIDNDTPGSNWDFSNVGGPKYPNGGYFVATSSEEPISYFGATVNYNTGAPVVTVLENTIGNVWFTYNGVGGYLLYRDSNFIPKKVFAILTNNLSGDIGLVGDNMALGFECYPSAPYIPITSTTNGTPTNGVLFNTPIEIRVYN